MGDLILHIERTSPYTSIQEQPRQGNLSLGVPPSGPLDSVSSRAANYLVGNSPYNPCIEMMLNGPVIRVSGSGVMATAGGNIIIKKNAAILESGTSFNVEDGDILDFSFVTSHRAAYLAVRGHWELPEIFGSVSYLSSAKIGCLPIKGQIIKIHDQGNQGEIRQDVPNFMKIETPDQLTLRAISGPEEPMFNQDEIDQFYTYDFLVGQDSNRVGFRLESTENFLEEKQEIISTPVCMGTVQMPNSGDPIVLMNDYQTTGGYPRIAKVIENDLVYLSQSPAGTQVKFRKVAIKKAREILAKREYRIGALFR